jgi:hypothetical protein
MYDKMRNDERAPNIVLLLKQKDRELNDEDEVRAGMV